MMRIAYVLETFEGGGMERRCLQLIQGLNRAGFNNILVIIINSGVDYPELYETSSQIHVIDRKRKRLSLWETYRNYYHIVNTYKPDIIQAWGELSMFVTNIYRLRHKFKYICSNVASCDGPSILSFDYYINQFSFFMADKVVGNSYAGLKSFRVPNRKGICIYNGFNEQRFNKLKSVTRENKCKELNIDHNAFIISMFSRVDNHKDYSSFLKLARIILSKRTDVVFLAVGKGEQLDYYKSQIEGAENGYIRFLGFREDVEELMYITDLSLLLTNYTIHGEGISNSIMESMAVGTPVIATDGGGTPEIITHSRDGFLVKDNDLNILTELILSLVDKPDKLMEMGRVAYQTIQKRFLLNKMIDSYISLYKNLK